jgi:Ca2+-transporting ATPase
VDLGALERRHPRETEIPFDADRKRMTTLNLWDESHRALVKGAPDVVLARARHWQRDGERHSLTEEDRETILEVNRAFAEEALRVLGFAYRDLSEPPSALDPESVEQDLVFVGLIGMSDPPRPEVVPAVATCRAAGIRPVVITGDYPTTAMAIARELGIARDDDRVLTGADLGRLADAELEREVEAVAVYARVTPRDKLRLVEAFQSHGHIVAMTGDGVNDAPALKRADIGVAMGVTGTDVAKGAADIVLADDNFASIVAAVEEGRGIFDNIRKFVLYLLSCNISEVLTIFVAILAGLPSPLAPVQILWVNLVTDGLPALALGAEPKESGLMTRPPRDPREGVLNAETRADILWYGGAITLTTLWAYFHGLYWHVLQPAGYETVAETVEKLMDARFWLDADLRVAHTMAFVTLAFSQLAHSLNCRSERLSLFQIGVFSNPRLLGAISLSILAQLAVVYLPLLQPVFRTVPITGRDVAAMLALSLFPLMFGEARKLGLRRWALGVER